jgi:ribosomal protein S18 acetylase RimI-like enzyme
MGLSITETRLDQALRVLANIPEFDPLKPITYYQKRLEDTPHLILVAQDGSKLVGCKIGYDRFADGSFYSWLGGVLPEYRKTGIAQALADHQEA